MTRRPPRALLRRPNRWCWLWPALLLGCGQSTLVTVAVTGAPPEIKRLRLQVTLGTQQTAMPEETAGVKEFGLYLPEDARGRFYIDADGIDAAGCVAARGRTDTTLAGQARVRMSLPMERLPAPDCTKK